MADYNNGGVTGFNVGPGTYRGQTPTGGVIRPGVAPPPPPQPPPTGMGGDVRGTTPFRAGPSGAAPPARGSDAPGGPAAQQTSLSDLVAQQVRVQQTLNSQAESAAQAQMNALLSQLTQQGQLMYQLAADAAAAAAAREAAIQAAVGDINAGFAGFNDAYFDSFAKDYVDYYNPKLQRQYADANRGATYRLANQGILDSSAAAGLYGDIEERRGEEAGAIAGRASDAAAGFQKDINSQKNDLIGQAIALGGGDHFGSAASSTASSIRRPGFEPLADVFGNLVNGGSSSFRAANSNRSGGGGFDFSSPFRSSSRVVN